MPLELPKLPFQEEALYPVISGATVAFHYGKHHKAYYDKLNTLIAGTRFDGLILEDIIRQSYGQPEHQDVFNNAGQAYNHDLYWQSLKPPTRTVDPKSVDPSLGTAYGNLDNLKTELKKAGASLFGSGWVWLILDQQDQVKVYSTQNANNPVTENLVPLLVFDVWEHAYYLDYQNRRAEHVTAVVDLLLNWENASKNLAAARAKIEKGRQLGLPL